MPVQIPEADVQDWLDGHPDWTADYFAKRMDVRLVNKWLVTHGFRTLQEYITNTRKQSLCQPEAAGGGNPGTRVRSESTPGGATAAVNGSGHLVRYRRPPSAPRETRPGFSRSSNRRARSHSRQYLRHDYALSKKQKAFSRTHEPVVSQREGEDETDRRYSLRTMRQFLSLPPSSCTILSMLIQSKVRLPRYASKDEELKRELRVVNERDFLLEIVRDISNDLKLRSLTSRILVNICILLDADRSSLFFVEKCRNGDKELVSKVFDPYTGTNCIPTMCGSDNVVRVKWGEGIIGHVAATGDTINLQEANKDSRYDGAVDQLLGYNTDSLLCMPIRNGEDVVIGVVQVANKQDDVGYFTEDDEKKLEIYLAFCGMAVSNAQAVECYIREYERNKALLEVAHDVFEEQTSVDRAINKLLDRACSLMKCDKCVVILQSEQPGTKTKELTKIYESLHTSASEGAAPLRPSRAQTELWCGELSTVREIAELVGATGETVNLGDLQTERPLRLSKGSNRTKSQIYTINSILCKPLRNNELEIIGVVTLVNKENGVSFDEYDDQLFEAFTIFCGLGINNCLLYDQVSRAAAKQTVALEVLSYHATVPEEQVNMFHNLCLSMTSSWDLNSICFNDFCLTSDEMVRAGLRIFQNLGLLKAFRIDQKTLVRWLLTVRKNYRKVAYHNWRHAFNVCQTMYAMITTSQLQTHLSDVERLALVVGSICHDLDHRGTNNAFQQRSGSALSQLYGTQGTLEHHHFNHAVMILNSEHHNIFSGLSSTDYSAVMNLLKHAILATDISLHLEVRERFYPLVDSCRGDWEQREHRDMLRSALMTACDIATITKPWEVQRRAADLVVTEFFDQGDKEKSMFNTQPPPLMDRERVDELPRLQIDWIDNICAPLFTRLVKVEPRFDPLLKRVYDNRLHWHRLDEQRQQNTVRETNV